MDIPSTNVYVGLKQSTRAIKKDMVAKLIVASDIEEKVAADLRELCTEHIVPVEYCGFSMEELGEAYGVKIGASMIAVLK